jgi:hypothetical protein
MSVRDYNTGYSNGYNDGVKAEREKSKLIQAQYDALVKQLADAEALKTTKYMVILRGDKTS